MLKTIRRERIILVSLGCLVCILLIFSYSLTSSRSQASNLQVSFINVGQGDSALIQAPDQENILIDGGPVAAGPTVVAYLKTQQVKDIDVLVASHNDADHVGGLADVLNSGIPVLAVIYNGEPGTTTAYQDFVAAMSAHGLVPITATVGQNYAWGMISAGVLNPQSPLLGDQNEDSVVLLIKYGQTRFLFPGDIGSGTEGTILAEGTPIAADVLKVAHHGSKYSSSAAFLSAVKPIYAVISVGTNNYGHPAAETLARLAAAGAQVLRTDQLGTIIIYSDGQSVFTNLYNIHIYMPIILR